MKKLLFCLSIMVFLHQKSIGQCNMWIGDSKDSIGSIKWKAEEMLKFELIPSVQNSKFRYYYSDTVYRFCQVIIDMEAKKQLVGNEIVDQISGIRSIKISGPDDRVNNLFVWIKQQTSSCIKYAAFASAVNFDKYRVVIQKDGEKMGIEVSTLTIMSNSWH